MWLIFMIWMQCKSYGQFGAIIFWTDSYFQEKVHPHSLTHHKIYWNRRDHLINIFMYVIDFIMCKRKGELSGFVRLLLCYTPVAGRAIYIQLPYNCLTRCIYERIIWLPCPVIWSEITCSCLSSWHVLNFYWQQKLLLIYHHLTCYIRPSLDVFSLFLEYISIGSFHWLA